MDPLGRYTLDAPFPQIGQATLRLVGPEGLDLFGGKAVQTVEESLGEPGPGAPD